MKAVILLAGKGRRISKVGIAHKSLIKLNENSMLYYLIKNVIKAGIKEIVPIVGYNGIKVLEEIEKSADILTSIEPIWNKEYETTNNLFSLCQARDVLEGEDFLLINGDMVFDYHILLEIMKEKTAQIAVDNNKYEEPIDSPRVIIKAGKIMDLGRHIPYEKRDGYAIGIYKYSKELSKSFFKEAEKMLADNINAGFHDPLVNLFPSQNIMPCFVGRYLWTDIDEEKDIERAKNIFNMIMS